MLFEMPSDALAIGVATGLGVSVLAGIISGVCYVLGYGNIFDANRRNRSKWHCSVCGNYLRSAKFKGAEFVVCSKCHERICKPKCCARELANGWICQKCFENTDEWMERMLKAVEPVSKFFRHKMSLTQEPIDEADEDIEVEKKKDKDVKEFMERLVNTLLCDDINDASVNKIYSDSNYLPVPGESPCSAHSALKFLIQRIIKEASSLPQLNESGTTSNLIERNKSYEDLLSTAILNKIISSSQNNLASSSYAGSVCSQRSSTSSARRRRREKEYFFGKETLDSKWADLDTTSVSSIEEWIPSDTSLCSTKYFDGVSLTIKQRIEEASTSESEKEEPDDVEYFRTKGAEEPNWFLQKRQFNTRTSSPVPVPMLVPDPTSEAKVLIGDQEVDQTSDLSDIPSDFDENLEAKDDSLVAQNLLLESKTIIGGKNPIFNLESRLSDDEMSADSGVKECKGLDDDSDILTIKTNQKLEVDQVPDASILSIDSNFEQDLEYTEKYATLPKTILVTPKNTMRLKECQQFYQNGEYKNNTEENGDQQIDDNESKFEGYYSKKEKEKWKNAVEMKNNPYSKENIEKRIKRQNSLQFLFGKDYYVKQASKPSGANKDELDDDENEDRTRTPTPNICEESTEEQNLYVAMPAVINQEDSEPKSDITEISDAELYLSAEITSDSDISWINCYDVSEAVVYRKIPAPKEFDDEKTESEEINDEICLNEKLVREFFETELKEPDKIEVMKQPVAAPRKSKTVICEAPKEIEQNFKLPNNFGSLDSLNFHHSEISVEPWYEQEEIIRLKEQKLVANRLKQFSSSSNNLNDDLKSNVLSERRSKTLDETEMSVRDLRKIFEQFDRKAKTEKPIYSLSGRSISKRLKDSLRMLEDKDASLSQVHSLSLSNLDECES